MKDSRNHSSPVIKSKTLSLPESGDISEYLGCEQDLFYVIKRLRLAKAISTVTHQAHRQALAEGVEAAGECA